MEYIEVTGKSVEEAITNACTKLGIPSDKLDYEVIDKGNSGFLGIFNSCLLYTSPSPRDCS